MNAMVADCEKIHDMLARDTEPGPLWEAKLQEWNLRYESGKRPDLNAFGYNYLGQTYEKAGQPKKALAAYRRSAEIRRQIEQNRPKDRANLHRLAVVHQDIGMLLKAQKRNDDAIAAWSEALAAVDRLLKLDQRDARNRNFKAVLLLNTAQLSYSAKPDAALTAAQEAIAILTLLVSENPSNVSYLSSLADSQYLRFLVLKQPGRRKQEKCEGGGSNVNRIDETAPSQTTHAAGSIA